MDIPFGGDYEILMRPAAARMKEPSSEAAVVTSKVHCTRGLAVSPRTLPAFSIFSQKVGFLYSGDAADRVAELADADYQYDSIHRAHRAHIEKFAKGSR
jgi:hypothetical protein